MAGTELRTIPGYSPSGPHKVRKHLILLFLYFALWWVANAPALVSPWWTGDDFTLGTSFSIEHVFQNGRPLALPLYYLLSMESQPYGAAINMGARVLQGLFHAASAVIIGSVLARCSGSRLAYLAAGFFLVYPFNGEAVLWRSAAMMPVACFVSLLGFLVAERGVNLHKGVLTFAGSAIVAASVLLHQQASIAALVLWCLVVVQRSPLRREQLLLGVWLGGGFLVGALLSITSTRLVLGSMPRGGISFDLSSKFPYVMDLVFRFIWDRYSAPITMLQAALVLLAFFAAGALLAESTSSLSNRLVRTGALLALVIAPFGPLLLTGDSPGSARMYYLAPLILVGCVLLLYAAVRNYKGGGLLVAVVTTLLVGLYIPAARASASDYSTLFARDVATIRAIESQAVQQNKGQPVTFVDPNTDAYLRSWDVYGMNPGIWRSNVDGFSDSKGSAFLIPWAFEPLVDQFTSQSVASGHEFDARCARQCNAQPSKKPFTLLPLEGGAVTCVCP